MRNSIKTKFTVASEEGIAVLQYLGEIKAQEKYSDLLTKEQLEEYLFDNYNRELIISELNTFSNQLVVVYVEDKPAGYAYLTGKGAVPEALTNKRVFHLQQFEILNAYKETGAKEVLMEKCMMICKSYDAVKMTEKSDETGMISFYEKYGFLNKGEQSISISGVAASVAILIKEN